MPRVELTRTQISRAGVVPAAEQDSDATNNHYFVDNGRTFLLVRNANAGAQTVTIEIPGEVDAGINNADRSVSINAAASKYIGPFDSRYWQPGTNQVYVNPSVTTDLKFSVYYI